MPTTYYPRGCIRQRWIVSCGCCPHTLEMPGNTKNSAKKAKAAGWVWTITHGYICTDCQE